MPPFWGSPAPVCHGGSELISEAQQRFIVTQAERRRNIIQADEKRRCDMKNGTLSFYCLHDGWFMIHRQTQTENTAAAKSISHL